MSFELPESVKIGHVNFDVIKFYFDQSEDFWYGRFEEKQGQIQIFPDQPDEIKQDTLMHEILHAMFFMAGWNPPQEERIVRALSPLLCGLIKDNPELMMFLQEQREVITNIPSNQNSS